MTITGAEKLKEELYQRKNVLRQKISKDMLRRGPTEI